MRVPQPTSAGRAGDTSRLTHDTGGGMGGDVVSQVHANGQAPAVVVVGTPLLEAQACAAAAQV